MSLFATLCFLSVLPFVRGQCTALTALACRAQLCPICVVPTNCTWFREPKPVKRQLGECLCQTNCATRPPTPPPTPSPTPPPTPSPTPSPTPPPTPLATPSPIASQPTPLPKTLSPRPTPPSPTPDDKVPITTRTRNDAQATTASPSETLPTLPPVVDATSPSPFSSVPTSSSTARSILLPTATSQRGDGVLDMATQTSAAAPDAESDDVPWWAIAIGVVGLLLVLIAAALLVVFKRRKQEDVTPHAEVAAAQGTPVYAAPALQSSGAHEPSEAVSRSSTISLPRSTGPVYAAPARESPSFYGDLSVKADMAPDNKIYA